MSEVIIEVSEISKRYNLGTIGTGTLYGDINRWGAKILGRTDPYSIIETPNSNKKQNVFWALNDISFNVNQGDILGIIGRNGAGKSTLLKILSRTTSPTKGKIKIYGRVASLLEVGTGFHPELTGRENIFLNGTILGMKKEEIKNKFDEIVDFSGVEKFVDTPVKRYSSGMYVRLAFTVAAFLDPEILIVDEVLAVGDYEFQKKCLGKMKEVSNSEGRTVLFVSHNMSAIENLCNKCLYLKNGQLHSLDSDVHKTILLYLNEQSNNISPYLKNINNEFSNWYFKLNEFWISDSTLPISSEEEAQTLANTLANNKPIYIHVLFDILEYDPALEVGILIRTDDGADVFMSFFYDIEPFKPITVGPNYYTAVIPNNFLNESEYTVELIVGLRNRHWFFDPGKNTPIIKFQIKGGLSNSPLWINKRPGILAPILLWEKKK
jgi:lipopolysaccharide transport system ATP-binding protein